MYGVYDAGFVSLYTQTNRIKHHSFDLVPTTTKEQTETYRVAQKSKALSLIIIKSCLNFEPAIIARFFIDVN